MNSNKVGTAWIACQSTRRTIHRAGELAEQYRLKAYDALHLATVDLMAVTLRSSVSFACFDDALNRAAAKMGFTLVADG